jgi:hypothetical protein
MEPSDVIATCSVVVATLAFIATLWQGWHTHRHNRLSVRPLLKWHINRNNGKNHCAVKFVVKNLGLGPAVIKERYFTHDNSRFKPNVPTDEVGEFLKKVIGKRINYELRAYGLPGCGAAIPSQSEVVIADIVFPDLPPDELWSIEHITGELDFHIAYESMYEEEFLMKASGED